MDEELKRIAPKGTLELGVDFSLTIEGANPVAKNIFKKKLSMLEQGDCGMVFKSCPVK